MKEIKIATRASKLALAQANQTMRSLLLLDPDCRVSLVEISTKGDRDKSDFLYKVGSMGFFTSEVEQALLDGRAVAIDDLMHVGGDAVPVLVGLGAVQQEHAFVDFQP